MYHRSNHTVPWLVDAITEGIPWNVAQAKNVQFRNSLDLSCTAARTDLRKIRRSLQVSCRYTDLQFRGELVMIFTKTQMQRWTHWLRLSASPPETSICISYLKGLSQGLESHVAFVEYLLDVFRKVKQRLVGLRYLLSLRGLGGCPHCAQNAFK